MHTLQYVLSIYDKHFHLGCLVHNSLGEIISLDDITLQEENIALTDQTYLLLSAHFVVS